MSTETEDALAKYTPFIVEIRKRLLFLLSVLLISGSLGFIYYQRIITVILDFFNLEGVNIVSTSPFQFMNLAITSGFLTGIVIAFPVLLFTSPFQFMNLAITSGFLTGIVIAFPVLLFQVLTFLKPALHSKEYRTVVALLPVTTLLFLGGFAFGVVTMRYVVILFYQRSSELQIGNFLDISLLLSQILLTAVLMGLAFQFPIILTILMRLKVINYKMLIKKRLLVYAISLIFATLLPPTDLLSLVVLFLPLALLFELTLILNRWVLKSHIL